MTSSLALDRRRELTQLLAGVTAFDEIERDHLAAAAQWIDSGAPLYRLDEPAVPPMHLVSYFVVLDGDRLLLVAHRKAGLWLPSGGHVEPLEDPWETVARECREELGIEAVASPFCPRRPFFVTVTDTRGAHRHTDVSLWYLLRANAAEVTSFDEGEFSAIRWPAPAEVLAEPIDTLDPHMHRFTRKLVAAQVSAG